MKLALSLSITLALSAQNPNTPKFPVFQVQDTDIGVAANNATTILSAPISSSTLTINVTNTTLFRTPAYITIEAEIIAICSKAAGSFTVCTGGRGFSNTVAAAHVSGKAVNAYLVDYTINQMAAEIKAIERAFITNGTFDVPLQWAWGSKSGASSNTIDFFSDGNGTANFRIQQTTGGGGAYKGQMYLQGGSVNFSALMNLYSQGPISSAPSINPTAQFFHITGTATISNITVPPLLVNGCLHIIPDGAFSTNTAGNIALASTAVVNRLLIECYDISTNKWYPNY